MSADSIAIVFFYWVMKTGTHQFSIRNFQSRTVANLFCAMGKILLSPYVFAILNNYSLCCRIMYYLQINPHDFLDYYVKQKSTIFGIIIFALVNLNKLIYY